MATITVAEPAERIADFIAGVGVNIHIGQVGDGAASVIAEMAFLGLRNVRAGAIDPANAAMTASAYAQLADAGLKFDWLTGGDLAGTLTDLAAFAAAHPGAVAAVEGPNEVNNHPITYGGQTGLKGALAYQQALYDAVTTMPGLAGVPVLDFTDSRPEPGAATAANAHPYPPNGREARGVLAAVVARLQAASPGQPIYLTETGYASAVGAAPPWGESPATQASLTLNLILDAAKLGVATTYLYDLVDDGADPSGAVSSDHFGLFTTAGAAKPVAQAIHNLTSILADTGADAADFTPGVLDFSLGHLPHDGNYLLLQASSGVYDLILWAEPPVWNCHTHLPLVPEKPYQTTVTFAAPVADVTLYDPLAGTGPISTTADATAITVGLTDHPLILQVTTFAAAMAAIAPTTGAAASVADAAAGAAPMAPTLATPLAG